MNKYQMFLASFGILLFAAFGCGDDLTLSDQPLQGTINGSAWTYSSGEATLNFDEDGYRLSIFAGTDEPCGFGLTPEGADERRILTSVPLEPGEYELSFGDGQTVTFTYPAEGDGPPRNMIATEGTILIDEVTDDILSGAMVARFDDDHEVNGNFELTRCDNQE